MKDRYKITKIDRSVDYCDYLEIVETKVEPHEETQMIYGEGCMTDDIVSLLRAMWVDEDTEATWTEMQAVTDAAADEIERLRAILDDWVKCAISVEIRDYGQPGYEEAMKALRKARRATYEYERERG